VDNHFWKFGCDATTLQPWNENLYVASPGYGPQDPNNFGGPSAYGEKLWMTGAASDALSSQLGGDTPGCGHDTTSPGCGKCILVTNSNAVNSNWKVIVMKKNRCPPWSNGCGAGLNHLDFAAPGYDNLQYSTANVCSKKQGTGFTSQDQSGTCGSWFNSYSSTQGCFNKCASLPAALRAGCELFSLWGWKSGNPDLTYEVVTCPTNFVNYIKELFGASGVKSYAYKTTYSLTKPTATPPPTTTPPPSTGGSSNLITFNGSNNNWIQVKVSTSIAVITKISFQSTAGYVDSLPVSGWSNHEFVVGSSFIATGSQVKIRIYDSTGKARYFTANWFDNSSVKETPQFSFSSTTTTTTLEDDTNDLEMEAELD
jgi:hypothetical protein